ncbi:MAG: DNA-binding protein [Ignavibacteriota bacterium]|nr:MAG: DNA-binding protein [Ignavibacteriota bacterium]
MKKTFILTDVLPEEIPLIYSNYYLYDFIDKSADWKSIDLKLCLKNMSDSEPFQFTILKKKEKKRLLSLPHPLAQLFFTKFIECYDTEIIHYFENNNVFSCRYPAAITRQQKIPIFFSDEEKEDWHRQKVKNYFKYPHVRITDFYKSNQLFDYELKYSLLNKLDVQQCFYHIYTHSIEWAFLGSKSIAKKNIVNKIPNLGYILDRVMQSSNNNETNGILVGPEFSRIVAEIVLARIDMEVYKCLEEIKMTFKSDYEVVRYIDDIFIFTNDEKKSELIVNAYIDQLFKFKLNINENKQISEKRPFLRSHLWVTDIKYIISRADEWLKDTPNKVNRQGYSKRNNDKKHNIIQSLKSIIGNYEDQQHYVVSYFISSITTIISDLLANDSFLSKLDDSSITDDNTFSQKDAFKIRIGHLLDYVQYAVIVSPTSKNIIKYYKICNVLYKFDESLDEILFIKCLEILKYNIINPEVYNLIIFLAKLDKNIPEDLLVKAIEKKPDYFKLSIVSYYLINKNRKFKYLKTRRIINNFINDLLEDINYQFAPTKRNLYQEQQLKSLFSKSDFILLHDFISCDILLRNTKRKIEIIFNRINRSYNNADLPAYSLFYSYIKDHDKPFMRWNYNEEDIAKIIEQKLSSHRMSTYGL